MEAAPVWFMAPKYGAASDANPRKPRAQSLAHLGRKLVDPTVNGLPLNLLTGEAHGRNANGGESFSSD